MEFVGARDTQKVEEIINTSWCAVSATGLAGALAEYVPALKAADILIANMGVEDEFGEELESSRVLNNKLPLNFILEEPTEIRYIDPSMALSNAALLKLLEGKAAAGINLPEKEFEMEIIADMRNAGVMNSEIDLILKESL